MADVVELEGDSAFLPYNLKRLPSYTVCPVHHIGNNHQSTPCSDIVIDLSRTSCVSKHEDRRFRYMALFDKSMVSRS